MILDGSAADLSALWRQNDLMASLLAHLRTSVGLPVPSWSTALTWAARDQALTCQSLNRLTHTGQDGSSVWDRVARARYPSSWAGEVAWWSQDAAPYPDAILGWLNSSGHRAALLEPRARHFGACGVPDYRGGQYLVMVLGSPR